MVEQAGMWSRADITLGVEQALDTIFTPLLLGNLSIDDNTPFVQEKFRLSKICRPRFVAYFAHNIFYNNYAIFYEIFNALKIEVFSEEQLTSILETNRDLILDSPYVDKKRYFGTEDGNIANDDDIISAITSDLVEMLQRLSSRTVTEQEFDSACQYYINWYKSAFAEYTALNMSSIMNKNGYEEKKPGKRTKYYQGLDDMAVYYNENMRIIKSLDASNRIRSHVVDANWLEEELQNENKPDDKSMFTIGIHEIDEYMGKLRRGHMIGIMGPPKGGKTRFTNFLVNRALSLGYNVCVWPLEGTSEEWEAMQEACYIARESHEALKRVGNGGEIIRIPSGVILKKEYLKDTKLRQQVAAAKITMATSNKVGRLSFIEGTAYVEDFLDVIESHWENENQFDVLVIDQLVNIMSKSSKGKVERISEAYMETKNFLANRLKVPALGIMPAQLKQDVVDYLRKNSDAVMDVTSGGESAETVRTPDAIMGVFSSKEERDNNIMKIYSVANRHNGDFPDFQCKCYLDCCYFMSEDD